MVARNRMKSGAQIGAATGALPNLSVHPARRLNRSGIAWCQCPACTAVLVRVTVGPNSCRHCASSFEVRA